MWQRRPFSLHVLEEKDSWCLYGSLDFGENVLDEWFVVSLLRHITQHVATLVARVVDTDGEILLIEVVSISFSCDHLGLSP